MIKPFEAFYTETKREKKKPETKERRVSSTSRSKTSRSESEDPCEICGLYKQRTLSHPKIEPYGRFRKRALVWGEGPGAVEDSEGRPWVGEVGQWFREFFKENDLDLDFDCLSINSVDCRPPDNRKPTNKELTCCWHRKKKILEESRPKVIFLAGDSAITSFYSNDPNRKFLSSLPLPSYRGKAIPDQLLKAWVCHSYHPSYILRGNWDQEHVFSRDFKVFARLVHEGKRPETYTKTAFDVLEEPDAVSLLTSILRNKIPISFDYETSSYRYHEGIHRLYLVSITMMETHSFVIRLEPELESFSTWLKVLKDEDVPKVAQNIKHEINAAWWTTHIETEGIVHDTMLATHLLDESRDVTGLKKQSYISFGIPDYSSEVNRYLVAEPKKLNLFPQLMKEFPEKAFLYSAQDSDNTYRLWRRQEERLKKEGLTRAYHLFHEGAIAFSKIERNGIRVNIERGRQLDKEWGESINQLRDKILSSSEAKKFEKVKGRPLKFEKKTSDADLRVLLFDVLKFDRGVLTQGGDASVNSKVLKTIAKKSELVKLELQMRRLFKLRNTYLSQFLRYEVNGFIYPTFNLHLTESERSSSSEPNFQNIPNPKRDPDWEEVKEVRKLIIPRKGREIWEVDYGSMEVRILACQSHDPVLMDYIINGGDMHADQAKELFQTTEERVGDKEKWNKLRYLAKNQFVFPEFYGSYHKTIAKNMEIPEDFFPVTSHDVRFEKWERHLEKVEERFWEKYNKTREWQDKVVNQYKRTGYVSDGAWGFRRRGYLTRNKLYNFPIQGPAYHCLQWVINEAVLGTMPELVSRSSDDTLLCAEIHDALFFDGRPEEFKVIRKRIDYLMTEKIREANPWIIVPLLSEWSRGTDWSTMKGVKDGQ